MSCGRELHPERAEKYDYCTRDECRAENARPTTIASVGVNKAADQFVVLNDRTREEMASARYQDPRRGSFAAGGRPSPRRVSEAAEESLSRPARRTQAEPRSRKPEPQPWTRSQQDQALSLYHTGRKPLKEIARRLGLSEHTVSEMLSAAYAGRRR